MDLNLFDCCFSTKFAKWVSFQFLLKVCFSPILMMIKFALNNNPFSRWCWLLPSIGTWDSLLMVVKLILFPMMVMIVSKYSTHGLFVLFEFDTCLQICRTQSDLEQTFRWFSDYCWSTILPNVYLTNWNLLEHSGHDENNLNVKPFNLLIFSVHLFVDEGNHQFWKHL